MRTILLFASIVAFWSVTGAMAQEADDDDAPAQYVETSVTLTMDGKVCGTPRGRMLSGVRSMLGTRLEDVEPKTWLSVDVTPLVEAGKIKYKMVITVERANGSLDKVTAEGVTDPSVPLKYAVGQEGTPYNAEVVFNIVAAAPRTVER